MKTAIPNFIEITRKDTQASLTVNVDHIVHLERVISGGVHIVVGNPGSTSINLKESYEEVQLKIQAAKSMSK
jgi:hypothetical protein